MSGGGCLRQSNCGQARQIVKFGHDTILCRLCGGDIESITAKMVFEAAALQDEVAIKLIDQAAKYIGVALATAINMLDPDTIYLCGGMMKNGDDFLERIKSIRGNGRCTWQDAML